MSNTGNRGVDEVALKNSISKWNSCTKVINDQIANLDEDERVIYEELYSYWRTSSFNKAYCKGKIESLKLYDKCHKGALLTANQEFRRRAAFFYAESESNFKAFQEDMKALMGTAPTPNPTPVQPTQSTPAARTETPQAETIDEMVSRWRKTVRSIKENQEQLSVLEQTCFEQLENFHQTSADFDPKGSSELMAILLEEVKKRGENTDMRIMLSNFLYLCLNLYTKSEDTYFEFQNTVKPRGQRVNRQPPVVNSGATIQQPRPTSTQPTSGSSTVAPENTTATTSEYEPWQNNLLKIIGYIWIAYLLYSFWTDGFWGGIWDGIKSGILGFIILCSVLAFKKLRSWLIAACVVAIIVAAFVFKGAIMDGVENMKEETPTTTEQSEFRDPEDMTFLSSPEIYHVTAKSGLQVRVNGDSDSRAFGTLATNQEIEVIGLNSSVAKIVYMDGVGFVNKIYIKKGKAPVVSNKPTTTATPAASKPKVTNTPVATKPAVKETKPVEKPKATPKAKPVPATPKTADEYYKNGVNLAKQFKESEAVVSLKKAVDMGSSDAAYYLGMMYVNGGEKTADGFGLVLKAANAGHKEAIFQVAELYNAGTGTAKDKTQAKVWYKKAEALGDGRATSRLRRL